MCVGVSPICRSDDGQGVPSVNGGIRLLSGSRAAKEGVGHLADTEYLDSLENSKTVFISLGSPIPLDAFASAVLALIRMTRL